MQIFKSITQLLTRSLWWKLALVHLLLSAFTILLMIVVVGVYIDERDFDLARQPQRLKQFISEPISMLSGRLDDAALVSVQLDIIRSQLSKAPVNGLGYGIEFSSDPQMSIAIYDHIGARRAQSLSAGLNLPTRWLLEAERLETVNAAERLLVLPIQPPERGVAAASSGLLVVRHTARFSLWKNIRNSLGDGSVATIWLALIMCAPGLLVGIGTATWLTRRLKRLARTTDAWTSGDLSPRIDEKSRDELGVHAEHLNLMADQLLRQIAVQQQLATAEERNRLARDLHDTVKQQTFAVGMQLHAAAQWLPRDPLRAGIALERAVSINQQAQDELAALLMRIKPADQARVALHAAFEQICLPWQMSQTNMRGQSPTANAPTIQLEISDGIALSIEHELELLRITQEALANVVKHARATEVKIRLRRLENQLELTVQDNGVGIEPGGAPRGLGLTTMRERAQRLPGGTLLIANDAGARVTILLDCELSE